MKALLLKKVLIPIQKPIDILLSVIVVPLALILLGYRRFGSAKLPKTTSLLKKIGVFPIRNHYYEPLFDDSQLQSSLFINRKLPGIDLNTGNQLIFMESLVYASELIELKLNEKVSNEKNFSMENGSFESGDAEYLYQIIRHIKPKKIIEIGSGNSTKIANLALQKNKIETKRMAKHICVEPYEMPFLEKLSNLELLRKKIEELNFNWSSELQAGDILFVDSSHIIRPQGDVIKEYLEIFPQLAQGVYIHIHDIFTPHDYPKSWIVDHVKFWNEQYLLEALLSNTDRYEIIGALNYLKHNYFEKLLKVCPYLTETREPGSFYIRVR